MSTQRESGDLPWMALVALAAFALFSLDWRNGLYGGVAEVGAMRVLAGDLPYRDFWTLYAPGQFYLLAGLFAVFGLQWLVSPIAASVLLAGATAAVAFDAKTSCCGGPVSVMSPERSLHLIEEILHEAQDAEADAALQRNTIRSKELEGLAKK